MSIELPPTFHPAPAGWRAGRINDGDRPDTIRPIIGWLVTITQPSDGWGNVEPEGDPRAFAVAVVEDAGAGTSFSADYWLAPGEEVDP